MANTGDVVEYRVRFDEGGPDGALRTSAYLRYMQDAASVHSSRLGYSRERYLEEGLFWLVRHLELTIHAPSFPGALVAVSTEVRGFRRIWARRRSEFRAPDGTLLAEADIDWVLTSQEGRPTRVPDDIVRAFPGLDRDYRPARLELPPAPPDATARERRAEAHETDPMGHVNNAAYLDQFEALLDDLGAADLRAAMPRRLLVEYLAPARLGAVLAWSAWPIEGGVAGSLRLDSGEEVLRVVAERLPAADQARAATSG